MSNKPPNKVAAMASMFQQPPPEKREEDKKRKVMKGRLSLPAFEDAAVKKKKAALKRTNSQIDRFSKAMKMFEKKSLEDISSFGDIKPSRDNVLTIVSTKKQLVTSDTSLKESFLIDGSSQIGTTNACCSKPAKNNISQCRETPAVTRSEFCESLSDTQSGETQVTRLASCDSVSGLSDNQSECQEYLAILESLEKVEYQKVEEEFDRLVEMNEETPPPRLKRGGFTVKTSQEVKQKSRFILSTSDSGPLAELSRSLNREISKSFNNTHMSHDTISSSTPSKDTVSSSTPNKDTIGSSTPSNVSASLTSLAPPTLPSMFLAVEPGTEKSEETYLKSLNKSTLATCEGNFQSIQMLVEAGIGLRCNLISDNDDSSQVNESQAFDLEVVPNLQVCENKTNYKESNIIASNDTINDHYNKCNTTSEAEAGINCTSLGSTLVGQSLSSWLATSSSISTNSLISPTVTSLNLPADINYSQNSQDHGNSPPSFDSSDLGFIVEAESEPVLQTLYNEDEAKVHYISDGNYWVEGAPLVPTCLLENTPTSSKHYKIPSRLRFSHSPIKYFAAYSSEEYDRKNDDIDSATASVEYELERRAEKMEKFALKPRKGENGLGISILGMGVGADTGVEKLGIFIKTIIPGGPADGDGRLQVNDQVISVDGVCLMGVTQAFAASVLRKTEEEVQFVVGREVDCGEESEADLDNDGPDVSAVAGVEGSFNLTSSCFMGRRQSSCSDDDSQDSSNCVAEEYSMSLLSEGLENTTGGEGKWEQVDEAVSKNECEIIERLKLVDEKLGENYPTEHKDSEYSDTVGQKIGKIWTLEKEAGDACTPNTDNLCSHEKSNKTLLEKYQQAMDTINEMKRNMEMVTEQLVTRDQLYLAHIDRVRKVVLLLKEQIDDTNKEAGNIKFLLEPRGALRRKPLIPSSHGGLTNGTDYSVSVLDRAIPLTQLLDSTMARDRISLVHRGALSCRRGGWRQSNYIQIDRFKAVRNILTEGANKFQGEEANVNHVEDTNNLDNGEKIQANNSANIIQSINDESILANCEIFIENEDAYITQVVNSGSLTSLTETFLPTSPCTSISGSLNSVPGHTDFPAATFDDKLKNNNNKSESLFKKARRRLSSR